MKTYLGIDLGGTNVRVAKVTRDGDILAEAKRPSYAQEGPEKVIANLIELIKEIPGYDKCEGMGIGVPGPVDTIQGCMKMSTNLPGFTDYPFTDVLFKEFNIPVFLDNDANVAGLAEAMVGAGKGMNVVYYTTLSTGIGGALIANGKVVSGKNGYAGEIANIIIDRNRNKYNHLNPGAVENEASGTAIARIGKERIGAEIKSAVDVFKLANQGDAIALDIIDKMAYDLAMMFSVIAHVVDPAAFVIGGGVMKSKGLFFDSMQTYYRSLVHEGMQNTQFLQAELNEPGIIGAALLPISQGL